MKKLSIFLNVLFLILFCSVSFANESSVTYYHNDVLGSPVAATDETGNLLWREDYLSYGARRLKQADSEKNSRWYTAHVEDQDTGLVYMGQRFYDPKIGRFMGVDPIGFQETNPRSFNRYAYANNNPYRYIDPNGESPVDLTFLAIDIFSFGTHLASGNLAGAAGSAVDIGFSVIGVLSPVPGAGQVLKTVNKSRKVIKKVAKQKGVTKGGQKLLETPRDVLLRNAQDPRLKDAINNLYRSGAKVGSGSTADAVRFEWATGELLSPKGHTQKLIDRRIQLMKLRKDPNLGAGDRRIIHDILKDTQDALSNKL